MTSSKPPRPKPQRAQAKPQFAFIHSSADDPTGKTKDDGKLQRTVRSYAMQYARRQKRWSTSRRSPTGSTSTPSPSADRSSEDRDDQFTSTDASSPSEQAEPSPPPPPPRRAINASISPTTRPPPPTEICLSCSRPVLPGAVCRCNVGNVLAIEFVAPESIGPPTRFRAPKWVTTNFAPFARSEADLLSIFFASVGPRFIPLDARHQVNLMMGWIAACLSHQAYMHSLCSVSAMHLLLSGQGRLEDVIYHKMKAEAYINLNLADPMLRAEDSNIGAIFNLLCVTEALLLPGLTHGDYRKDDARERVIHLKGLRHLIDLRGGLPGLTSRCLRTFILWHSTAQAVASSGDLYLSFAQQLAGPMTPLSFTDTTIDQQEWMVQLCLRLAIRPELIRVVSDTSRFADALQVWHTRTGTLDFLDLIQWSCTIIHRLLFLADACRSHPMEEALAITLIMFANRASEMVARTVDPLRFGAVGRLKAALLAVPWEQWAPAQDLHLWICAVGALAAPVGVEQRGWLVSHCRDVSRRYIRRGEDEFIQRLQHCLWIEQPMRHKCHRLWVAMDELPA